MDEYRLLKNIKNRLSRSIKADKIFNDKKALKENYWQKVKRYSRPEQRFPTRIRVNNKLESSPSVIAESFNDFFIDKVSKIRENIPNQTFDPLEITEACIKKPDKKNSIPICLD